MKVVICGSRDCTDGEAIFRWLDMFHAGNSFTANFRQFTGGKIELVIEGGQRKWDKATRRHVGGADFWAHQWAKERGVQVITVKAEWDNLSAPGQQREYHGGRTVNLAAGPIRNRRMATEFGATHCISFGGGRGTASMEFEAKLAGLEIIAVTRAMLDEVAA